jgi:hypothetical protein
MSGVLESLALAAHVASIDHGATLPEGRIVVIAVPLLALGFYFLVVRRNRNR